MQASLYVKQLIRTNELHKAIQTLEELTKSDKQLQDILVIQSAALNKLENEARKGTLSKEEISRKLAQIQVAILGILDEVPLEKMVDISFTNRAKLSLKYFLLRYRMYSIFILVILNAGLVLYLQSIPQNFLPTEIQLEVSKVSFKFVGGGKLFNNQHLKELQLQGFTHVFLQANDLELDLNADGFQEFSESSIGAVSFNPIKDNADLFFEDVWLQEITFNEGSKVVLTIPHENSDEEVFLNIDLINSSSVIGLLAYRDSVNFEAHNITVDLLRSDQEIGYLMGTARDSGEVRQIEFGSTVSPFTMFLVVDSMNLEKRDLMVDSLLFTRRYETATAISSIYKGSIELLTSRDKQYHNIAIKEGEFLRLVNQDNMRMLKLVLNDNKIKILLRGEVSKILVGATPDQMVLRNPPKLKWIWHNRTIVLFSYLLVLLVIIFSVWFFPRVKSSF